MNEQLIQSIYKIEDAIQVVEAMLAAIHRGQVENSHRTVLMSLNAKGLFSICQVRMGRKWQLPKLYPFFLRTNLLMLRPHKDILLTELEAGKHISLLSASYLTWLRTCALSAISTRHLVRRDSKGLTVIGKSAMAFEQVLGLVNVLPIQDNYLVNRSLNKTYTFSEKHKEAGVTFTIQTVSTPEMKQWLSLFSFVVRPGQTKKYLMHVKAGTQLIGGDSYLPEIREIPL
ncbi:hypothetical protein [Bacillus sp. B-jedd]|uniref:hypothetical protein n=1 Tax=Bacillus sp. B-jedd TaxID=1476857 RepID=UPI0005155EEA|nr:hypothetical protein [Bacillus sp. B-jedd]CEG26346.1 ornithine cyclodeaminase [Bacillus sp. B-jedd]